MFCAGSQAKKQARAAEAARREEERTAVKRAKEEATRRQRDSNATATTQIFDVRIFFDGLIFFQMIIDDACCNYNICKYNYVMMLQDDASRPARSS